ncbi:TetR/AcrR family transcriptional regulator [Fusibacter bizertensis]|uniref:TetR/AcrR family transcriptional regulator n=1 Tax=Fusibacter bizertensis TaxID=1488331 RepID=A0ABT6NF77_9FIRM|nr:TetR/AcrR family transcriptional regulator [Fusibacter bizertensis]MDH8679037.1 TetR/AcrR family transcriptional regulator [Fusibacter bizertensis]
MGKQKTYKRILEYSRNIFFEVGYSKVSMDELVHEIGMSKATLYRYYSSKEELFEAVVDDFFDEIEEEIYHILNTNLSSDAIIEKFIYTMSKRLSIIDPNAAYDIEKSTPLLFKKFLERRKIAILDNLVNILENGKKEGIYRSDISSIIVANIILASIDQLTKKEFVINNEFSYSDIFGSVISTVIDGYKLR